MAFDFKKVKPRSEERNSEADYDVLEKKSRSLKSQNAKQTTKHRNTERWGILKRKKVNKDSKLKTKR